MADTTQARTEAASPRRRAEARKQGQVASSGDLTAALVLISMLLLMSYASPAIGRKLLQVFSNDLPATMAQHEFSVGQTVQVGRASSLFLISTSSALLVGGFVLGVAANVLQIGFHPSAQTVALKPSRLSPTNGIKKIFSARGAVRTTLAIVKFTASGSAILAACYVRRDSLLTSHGSLVEDVVQGWENCLFIALISSVALLVAGGIDFLFQRWQHDEDIKMTRQEVKDETKESDGDPRVKAKIRQLQSEAAKLRTLNEVPKASVVITNPTHIAVAIRYERGIMAAPKVVAKGKGIMAKRIRKRALESGVPIVERKPIARALFAAADVGSEIPTSLYRAVAEILAHVYGLRR